MPDKVYQKDDPSLGSIRVKKGVVLTDNRRTHVSDYVDLGEVVADE